MFCDMLEVPIPGGASRRLLYGVLIEREFHEFTAVARDALLESIIAQPTEDDKDELAVDDLIVECMNDVDNGDIRDFKRQKQAIARMNF